MSSRLPSHLRRAVIRREHVSRCHATVPGPRLELGWGCPQGILSPSRLASFATPACQTTDGRRQMTGGSAGIAEGRPAGSPPCPPLHLSSALCRPSSEKSGKRDSNPRPQPWQGCALPTELFPRLPLTVFGVGGIRAAAQTDRDGGEGNRTPDLLNAIQALSQLSYAPQGGARTEMCRQEPQTIAVGIGRVNEGVLAKIGRAGILQRLTRTSDEPGCAFQRDGSLVHTRRCHWPPLLHRCRPQSATARGQQRHDRTQAPSPPCGPRWDRSQ